MTTLNLQVDGEPTPLRIREAATWWTRAIGLLATAALDDPSGLWIRPCNSVHTIGMRYPIDVVFLRRDGHIAKIVEAMPPWRASACRQARSTLELRAGLARRLQLAPGRALAFVA
jgi:uncharacterized protein